MYCSGCGQPLTPGQAVCAHCGRPTAPVPAAPPAPPIPNIAFEVANYATRVRALSTVWFIYGGLVLITGLIGLSFASSFFNGGFGPWMHGPRAEFPFGSEFGHTILRFAWVMVILRASLAFIAGWGLMERTSWGRVVAIVAAFLSILKIPFGTAIAIWTLVTLLGYRNTTLYDQL
ncbi:MAG TPA: zinc ribbon domain-containing protein [Terracidiphilus sp.]|jgi:hypothetical protein|nr:zinc ribbon domain-containing protein [Terracidiphilus sp.]